MENSSFGAYLDTLKRFEIQELAKMYKLKANAKSSVLKAQLQALISTDQESGSRMPLRSISNSPDILKQAAASAMSAMAISQDLVSEKSNIDAEPEAKQYRNSDQRQLSSGHEQLDDERSSHFSMNSLSDVLLSASQLENIQNVINIDPEMDNAREEALKSAEVEKTTLRERKLAHWSSSDLFSLPESVHSPFLSRLVGCESIRQAFHSVSHGNGHAEVSVDATTNGLRCAVARILELEQQAGRWYGADACRSHFEEVGERLAADLRPFAPGA